jgi:hypothetical protein
VATAAAKAAAKPLAEPEVKPVAKAGLKPVAKTVAKAAAPRRRAARRAGVRIMEDAEPALLRKPEPLRPAPVPGGPAEAAPAKTSFPRLPDIRPADARIAAASAIPSATLSQPEPRLSRSRAVAGWYIFLAVLAVASFSVTNLAVNHDTTLSIETGVVAALGLVAVVVLLVTGP